MPPMMLLPLIDHAIARGFGPPRAVGAIRIRTDVTDRRLRFTITDSGAGFVSEAEGEGLAAIRERLMALYGAEGALKITRSDSTSTEVVLDIPLEHRALPGILGKS